MSLDTVELVFDMEKAFGIEIPDAEAENIGTIEQMALWFYTHLPLQKPEKPLQQNMLDSINRTLKKLKLVTLDVKLTDQLNAVFIKEGLSKNWESFEDALGMKTPKLNSFDFATEPKRERQILGLTYYKPKSPFLNSSFERLIECIGALNYLELVDFDNITSLFEIRIAVMGITCGTTGVNAKEVFWESSFTSDLGID